MVQGKPAGRRRGTGMNTDPLKKVPKTEFVFGTYIVPLNSLNRRFALCVETVS
jgi:hypothetical protein